MPRATLPPQSNGRARISSAPADDLSTLIRLLVRRAVDEQARRRTCHRTMMGRVVLVDTVIEGVRCVLIAEPARENDGEPVTFSPRELEIARLIAKGHANKTIAAILEISTWTVGTYIRRIFAKLNVGSRAAMVSRIRELDGIAVE